MGQCAETRPPPTQVWGFEDVPRLPGALHGLSRDSDQCWGAGNNVLGEGKPGASGSVGSLGEGGTQEPGALSHQDKDRACPRGRDRGLPSSHRDAQTRRLSGVRILRVKSPPTGRRSLQIRTCPALPRAAWSASCCKCWAHIPMSCRHYFKRKLMTGSKLDHLRHKR